MACVYTKQNSKLYHKGNPYFRNHILKEGLVPQVGDSYAMHWEGKKSREELEPLVFLYDKDVYGEYDSTYDDDVWEIDRSKLDESKLKSDKGLEVAGIYTYSDVIPKSAIKLIHKGTGE